MFFKEWIKSFLQGQKEMKHMKYFFQVYISHKETAQWVTDWDF